MKSTVLKVTYSHTDAPHTVWASQPIRLLRGGAKLCFKSTECPTADYEEFLTLYPTSFTVLDEMLAYSHYRTNQLATYINQDVPTYFHAVQRSRLPMVAMPMDRGLSDTDVGEANHKYCSKKRRNW